MKPKSPPTPVNRFSRKPFCNARRSLIVVVGTQTLIREQSFSRTSKRLEHQASEALSDAFIHTDSSFLLLAFDRLADYTCESIIDSEAEFLVCGQ